MKKGKARIEKHHPFTIRLHERTDGVVQSVEFKVDPGSKTTGLALVADFPDGKEAVWGANLTHRGHQVKAALDDRRMFRRGRRGRKCRYRKPRFKNRTRAKGWLPPSLRSRVDNVAIWYDRLLRLCPITEVCVETVRFDTQAMQRPGIKGIEYQQGELAGYEIRQYVLSRGNHKCAYCGAKDVPLQMEHIHPRSKGGTNRVSNLVPACEPCNTRKGAKPVEQFLARKPNVLAQIKRQLKVPLKDTAAVNATRYVIGNALKEVGLPVSFWSGGRTKWNRTKLGYEKDHWIDAACVGSSGADVFVPDTLLPLHIKAKGRGRRRVCKNDKYGFPNGTPRKHKRVGEFQTGDFVELVNPTGKFAGVHLGHVAAARANGQLVMETPAGMAFITHRKFNLLQKADGYEYATIL